MARSSSGGGLLLLAGGGALLLLLAAQAQAAPRRRRAEAPPQPGDTPPITPPPPPPVEEAAPPPPEDLLPVPPELEGVATPEQLAPAEERPSSPLAAKEAESGGAKVRAEVTRRIDEHTALFASAATPQVPAHWLKGIAAAESSGRPDSGANTSGYKGLMQCEQGADQLEPAKSIRDGAAKLNRFDAALRKQYADYAGLSEWARLRVLATAYNAGPGTVYKALDYAREGGDMSRWRELEVYARALIWYGAYSTSAYASKAEKADKATIQEAESWRRKSRKQGLTLAQLQEQGAPELVIRSIRKKAENTAPYLGKIVAYARHYSPGEKVA